MRWVERIRALVPFTRSERLRAAFSAMVLKMLTARYAQLPQDIEARLTAADLAQLQAIAERSLEVDRVEEALGQVRW